MPQFWGADSVETLNFPESGTTCANYVINTQYGGSPHDQIVWWGRYFDYGYNQSGHWQGDVEANSLSNAVKGYKNPTNNASWVLPIAFPIVQNTDHSHGVYDANYVGGVIKNALSGKTHLPGGGVLYVYLDIERGLPTSVGFLQGWVDGINAYPIGSAVPLYPACYINPGDTANVSNADVAGFDQAWSNQPNSNCSLGECNSPGASWRPTAVPQLTTNVWQYGFQGACPPCRNNQRIIVDLDLTNPSVAGQYGNGQCDNMLYISP